MAATDSKGKRTGPPFSHIRSRYWVCICVHVLVFFIRGAMAVIWGAKIDRRFTLDIGELSRATSILNFSTLL
jgi:hypothetical protein